MTDPHTLIDLDLTFKETTHKLHSVIETLRLIVCLCVWSLQLLDSPSKRLFKLLRQPTHRFHNPGLIHGEYEKVARLKKKTTQRLVILSRLKMTIHRTHSRFAFCSALPDFPHSPRTFTWSVEIVSACRLNILSVSVVILSLIFVSFNYFLTPYCLSHVVESTEKRHISPHVETGLGFDGLCRECVRVCVEFSAQTAVFGGDGIVVRGTEAPQRDRSEIQDAHRWSLRLILIPSSSRTINNAITEPAAALHCERSQLQVLRKWILWIRCINLRWSSSKWKTPPTWSPGSVKSEHW